MSESESGFEDAADMRVLMLATTYPLPSAKVRPGFIKDFAEELRKSGCVVRLVLPHHAAVAEDYPTPDPRLVWFRYAPMNWERIAYGDGIMANIKRRPWLYMLLPAFLLGMTVRMARELRANRWDIIHAHWWFPCGLAAVLARKISRRDVPLVITCHGGDFYALAGRWWDFLKKNVLRSAQQAVAVSSSMRCDMLALGVDVNRCSLGPMGVDLLEKFVPPRADKERKWDLLFVGRFAEKKGITVLLDALSILDESKRELRVCIVGDGPLKSLVRSRIEELNDCHVKILGSVPNEELPGVYQESRIFVFPSLTASDGDQEGLGLVTIEALGCGCDVIASDLTVLRDVLIDRALDWRFPAGDSVALSGRIIEALDSPSALAECSNRARKHVVSTFDWRKVAEVYCSIYRKCNEYHF